VTAVSADVHRSVRLSGPFGRADAATIAIYAVVYAIVAFIGRQTLMSDTGISMIWPAAGASILWLISRAGRPLIVIDYALLGVITTVVVLLTNGTPITAIAGGFAAALQGIICSAIIRVGCAAVWDGRGVRLQGRDEFWSFVAAATIAPVVSAPLIGTESLVRGSGWEWEIVLLWCARNIVSILVIAPIGFTVLEWIRRRVAHVPVRPFSAIGWSVRAHPAEWIVLLFLVPAIYWFWFTQLGHLNLVFPLLAFAFLSGVRLPASVVAVQGALITLVVIVTTVDGTGPFDDTGDPSLQIAAAHLYIALVIVIGLALTVERDEGEARGAALAVAQREAESQATLLRTIIDTMSEGVRVVDPRGQVILRNRAADLLLLGREAPGEEFSATDDLTWVRDAHGRRLDGDPQALVKQLPPTGVTEVELFAQPPGVGEERIITLSATRLPAPADGVVTVMRDVTAERRELRRAAQVQEGLLPTEVPHLPGYELAARFVPAGSVGGDFYDWYTVEDGVVLTLADVMGKGTGAAILAATTRSLLRAHGADEDVVRPLLQAERGMARDLDNAGAFVTLFRAFVHAPTGAVTYTDAGHGLAAVLTRDGAVRRLPATGLPLGIDLEDARVEAFEQLDPGDTLLVVSDGVLDAVGGSLADMAIVWDAVPRGGPATEAVESVVQRAAGGDPDDDLTVLALRRHA
jgi:PAS domain-containing protein